MLCLKFLHSSPGFHLGVSTLSLSGDPIPLEGAVIGEGGGVPLCLRGLTLSNLEANEVKDDFIFRRLFPGLNSEFFPLKVLNAFGNRSAAGPHGPRCSPKEQHKVESIIIKICVGIGLKLVGIV